MMSRSTTFTNLFGGNEKLLDKAQTLCDNENGRNSPHCVVSQGKQAAYSSASPNHAELSVRPKVIIESPYRGAINSNTLYLHKAIKDSIARGEAPFASHAFYPQFLQEEQIDERVKGIWAGFAWGLFADLIAFYADYGWSEGMCHAKEFYKAHGIKTETRWILSTQECI